MSMNMILVDHSKLKYLMSIAEERFKKIGKELSDSDKDCVYFSIHGVYQNCGYDAAYNYALYAELSI